MGNDVGKEAKKDAERLLKITGNLGVAVEPVGIARRLGVQVFKADLRRESLGGLLITPGEDPEIVLNKGDGLIRRRMTCAYELGHYVLESARTNDYARVDLREPKPTSEVTREERYAQEFAACLLMPDALTNVLVEMGMDDLEMAVWLLVPREAMQLRLNALGLRTANLRAA